MIYRHNQSHALYRKLATALDHTNATEGRVMVVYHPYDDENNICVREQEEFEAKFTLARDFHNSAGVA